MDFESGLWENESSLGGSGGDIKLLISRGFLIPISIDELIEAIDEFSILCKCEGREVEFVGI